MTRGASLIVGLMPKFPTLGTGYADDITRFWPSLATIVAVLGSFLLFLAAMKGMGTAHAVRLGIGAMGTAVVTVFSVVVTVNPPRVVRTLAIHQGTMAMRFA